MAAIGLWALGQHYAGDTGAARRVLADHAAILQSGQPCFIHFVRAELAATTDPAAALRWLEQGARQARRDRDFLGARMIEIAQLALHVRSGERAAASRLARGLIDELLLAGMIPQVWMALRHVAALLFESGAPRTAARILDSAAASADATELVGEAVHQEADLRLRIRDALACASSGDLLPAGPMAAGELWPEVDRALACVERA